jgi:hypothetical protein
METLIAERDDRLVPIRLQKFVSPARLADIPATGASGGVAKIHRR